MIDSEQMTPEAELQALKDLVASDGWQVVQAHVEQAWGDRACLDKIDEALAKGTAIEDELAVTKRIRDTFRGVRAEAAWVRRRITELEAIVKAQRGRPAVFDRFAGLRRTPR